MFAILKDPNTMAMIAMAIGAVIGWYIRHSALKMPPAVLATAEKMYEAWQEAEAHGLLANVHLKGQHALPAILGSAIQGAAIGAGIKSAPDLLPLSANANAPSIDLNINPQPPAMHPEEAQVVEQARALWRAKNKPEADKK